MSNSEKIAEIMEYFNFEKVYRAMTLLNWKWSNPEEGKERFPTLEEIREQASRMLHDAIKGRSYSTGGFSVKYNSSTGCLSLSFVLDEWESI